MANLFAVFYLLAFILSGICIGMALLRKSGPGLQCYVGGTIGLILLCWLPALFSFVSGSFDYRSQLLALAAVLVFAVAALIIGRPKLGARRIHVDPYALIAILPFFLLSLYLLHTHTIRNVNGALHVGQSTYGDLAMHLGFITSITEQKTFPPMYSICPDVPLCYPFLCDSVSSTFYTLGADLRIAVMLPAAYALLLAFSGAYILFCEWSGSRKTAFLANALFFLGGGFGFAYFFDLAKSDPGRMETLLHGFYKTPTNLVEKGMRWVNPIADMLIPQRATLFGWAVLFCCLTLLFLAVYRQKTEFFPLIGCMAGSLPLIHTHSFLALGIISVVWLLISFVRCVRHKRPVRMLFPFIIYGLIACAFALPQLIVFTFRQSGGFLRFHWNWGNYTDNTLWFYVKNWGLLFLLLPAALLTCSKEDRLMFAGPGFLWFLSEIILFQPNSYDNNKLLFVVYLYICGLIAKHIVWLKEHFQREAIISKLGMDLTILLMTLSMFVSGILTLAREALSDYELLSAQEVRAAEFIRGSTEPDSTFLTCTNHNNAVAMLTGRNIVCGSGTFLYYHGVDYTSREQAVRLLYEQPQVSFELYKETYGIDYVYIGNYERSSYKIDLQWFEENTVRLYDREGICIFGLNRENPFFRYWAIRNLYTGVITSRASIQMLTISGPSVGFRSPL